MVSILTQYLLQYKRVDIPHVGRFELIAQPAIVSGEDTLIHPATYTAHFSGECTDHTHQVHYMSAALQKEVPAVLQQLNVFGMALRKNIQQQAFLWNGIGRLEGSSGDSILFHPMDISLSSFKPVSVVRVLREEVPPMAAVQEQEIKPDKAENRFRGSYPAKKNTVLIAGVVLLISIAFIVLHFYKNGLQPSSSGYQKKVMVPAASPTYR